MDTVGFSFGLGVPPALVPTPFEPNVCGGGGGFVPGTIDNGVRARPIALGVVAMARALDAGSVVWGLDAPTVVPGRLKP